MKTKTHVRLLMLLVLTLAFSLQPSAWLCAAPLGTAFTYQGRLNDGANPAAGSYDLRFRVWDSEINGAPASTTLTYTVSITNGLFTVLLDFGSGVFTGQSRWLEMSVSTNGAGAFTPLTPRQSLTPAPYAINAANVSGSVPAAQISGTLSPAQLPATVVTNNSGNLSLSGAFTGTGTSLSNVNAAALGGIGASGFWQLGGNNVASGQFLGSTNSQAVEIRANNLTALRLVPPTLSNYSNVVSVIGGSPYNFIDSIACGSVIAGGGMFNAGATPNTIFSSLSFIGGGSGNSVGTSASYATLGGGRNNSVYGQVSAIVGGSQNTINGSGYGHSFIGGGDKNYIDGDYGTIAGGAQNSVLPSASYTFIGGGALNSIVSSASGSVIAGGYQNTNGVSSLACFIGGGQGNFLAGLNVASAIVAGFHNTIKLDSHYGFIGGGEENVIDAQGYYSVLVGGSLNSIGTNVWYGFVGGGIANTVSSPGAVVVGGGFDGSISLGNTASGIGSAIVGGTQNLASGNRSTIGGGHNNSATSFYATVPGGAWNLAGGEGSLAAGRAAKSLHDASFVWNDYSSGDFVSTAANQFLVHASGGVGINTNNPNGAALNVNGIISATGFSGSGAGLSGVSAVSADLLDGQHGAYYQNAGNLNAGSLSDARLSANVALLNSSQTFSAAKNFNAGLRMNFTDLYFASGSDVFHGLGWYGSGKLFAGNNVNGPVLYGYGGGALGAIGATTNLALQWTSAGNVALDPLAANTGSLLPGLTFGGNSGEGISSKRTAGTGQFGLDFYANYALRMRIGNNGNVGINTDNPQSALHVNGTATVDANLRLPVTKAGAGIIYFGTNTFLHGVGDYNFFAGESAGNLTMTGYRNVGIGWNAMADNVSGGHNIGVGYGALTHNVTGEFNTASGTLALCLNTNGNANTANGYMALYYNTSGHGNTATGVEALWNNTTGSRNVALGYFAGFNLTTGTNNICIGNAAGYSLTTGGTNIAIGNVGAAADTNTIRIGTQGSHTRTFLAGIYGVTASGGSAVYVNSSGQLGTSTSSRRFKTDIQDMGDASAALLALRPVTFRYLPEVDAQGLPQFGLIAEEVEQVNPDLVVHDEQGRPYTVRYEAVNAMLLQEFLKDHRRVEAHGIAIQGLNQKLEAQHAENAELKARLEKLERLLEHKFTGGAK